MTKVPSWVDCRVIKDGGGTIWLQPAAHHRIEGFPRLRVSSQTRRLMKDHVGTAVSVVFHRPNGITADVYDCRPVSAADAARFDWSVQKGSKGPPADVRRGGYVLPATGGTRSGKGKFRHR